MCCRKNNRRALQARQIAASLSPPMSTGVTSLAGNNHHHQSGVNALIGAVSNLAIQPHNAPPQYASQASAYPVDDKKSLLADAPPPYERATREHFPEVATREMTNSTYSTMKDQVPSTQSLQLPPQFQTASPQISKLIEGLTAALAAYQSGSGRHRHVRSAQRAIRNELYESEIQRRQAMYGRLRCGERCEIWREIKAIDLGL